MSKSTITIHQAQRVSAAWRVIEPLANGSIKSVCRRYNLTERQLKRAVVDLLQGNFKKGSHWNPAWDHPDVKHHPIDSVVMTDIENGHTKGSDIDLLMDPDFDPVNGICHLRWSEDDVLTLCEGLPYRLLEIIRDVDPSEVLFQEAVAFMDSSLFKTVCDSFGYDRDELLLQSLNIAKAHM